jgi:hypothetical protein
MAYQRGLPILIARERGVIIEGMLETIPGCRHLAEFDLDRNEDPFRALADWAPLLVEWSEHVRALR